MAFAKPDLIRRWFSFWQWISQSLRRSWHAFLEGRMGFSTIALDSNDGPTTLCPTRVCVSVHTMAGRGLDDFRGREIWQQGGSDLRLQNANRSPCPSLWMECRSKLHGRLLQILGKKCGRIGEEVLMRSLSLWTHQKQPVIFYQKLLPGAHIFCINSSPFLSWKM